MEKTNDSQKTTYAILTATFAGLYLVGVIALFFQNNVILDQNNKLQDDIDQIKTDQQSLVLANWQEIVAARRTLQIDTIPPIPTNKSVDYAIGKTILVSSPSCPMCQDQEDQIKALGIEYTKICFQITAQDGVDCSKDKSYADTNISRQIILGYDINAVPTIINGNHIRTGMIYWNLTKEKNDLQKYLSKNCNDSSGLCSI